MSGKPAPDEAAQVAVEGRSPASPQPTPKTIPPAGPHASPDLQREEATPGAGTLTPSGEHDDVDATSG